MKQQKIWMTTSRSYVLFLFLMPLFLLSSCASSEEEGLDDAPVGIRFESANVAGFQNSTQKTFTSGDRVGIYLYKPTTSSSLDASTIIDGAENLEYISDANGSLSPVGEMRFYPQNGDSIYAMAYFPYKSSIKNGTYPIDLSDQSQPEKIDLINSRLNITSGSKTNPIRSFTLVHRLSKLSMEVKAGLGFKAEDLINLQVSIEGMPITAEASLYSGSIMANSPKSFAPRKIGNSDVYDAIVIPLAYRYNRKVVFTTMSGGVYEWEIPNNLTFTPNAHHRYVITINKTGISVSGGNIIPWNTTGTITTGESTSNVYQVGDYYPNPYVDITDPVQKAKIEGIVFEVSNGGLSGKIVGLREASSLQWSDTITTTNAFNEIDGRANMATVEKHLLDIKKNWSNFPAFDWCRSQGPGWYLPAMKENSKIVLVLQEDINIKLSAIGATPITGKFYFSSTEVLYNPKFAFFHKDELDETRAIKTVSFSVRAVKVF